MSTPNQATRSAFSLIELVIVIAIIGVITTIAVPRFADAGSGRRLSAAKKTLLSDIEMVKLRARATSKVHAIKFYPSLDMYVIVEGSDVKKDAVVLLRDFRADPFDLIISRTSLSSPRIVVITPYGDVSPAFSVGIEDDGVELTIVVDGLADVGVTPVLTMNAAAADTLSLAQD